MAVTIDVGYKCGLYIPDDDGDDAGDDDDYDDDDGVVGGHHSCQIRSYDKLIRFVS